MDVIWEDKSYGRTCVLVGHVVQKGISYRRTCLTGHILWDNMSYGGQVFLKHIPNRWTMDREEM